MRPSIIIIAAVCLIPNFVSPQNFCKLDVVGKYPEDSLLVDQNGKLRYPLARTDRNVLFHEGEAFYLICPDGSFQSNLIDDRELVVCIGNTKLRALNSSQVVDFKDIQCITSHRPLAVYAKFTKEPCANNQGNLTYFQYKVDWGNVFVTAVTLCFDEDHTVPSYTKYTSTSTIGEQYGYKDANVVSWNQFYMLDQVFNVYYSSKERLESLGIYGYITDEVFLEIEHLASPDDLFFSYIKDITYVLENVVFQWNTFRDRNWKNTEIVLRNLIEEGYFGDMTVIRGVLGVASLPNNKDNIVELYLNHTEQRFPVPRWFYKIIFSESNYSGLILIGYNNPYVPKAQVDYEFTQSICKTDILYNRDLQYIANVVDNTDSFSGFTYVCALDVDDVVNPVLLEIIRDTVQLETTPNVFQVRP